MWLYGPLHIFVLYVALSNLGWLYGTLFVLILIKVTDKLLDKIGYVRFNHGDLLMTFEKPGVHQNLGVYFTVQKIDYEKFKEEIYNRGILHIRKLNQIRAHFLGMSFWKDTNFEIAKAQIKKCTKDIKTDQQCVEYVNELLNEQMPIDKPQWEMYFLEDFSEEESVIFMKMHHCFTDAMGFVGMLSFLHDNQLSFKADKKFPILSILERVFFTIVGPVYTLYLVLYMCLIPQDKNSVKINELKQKDTFNNRVYASEEFQFDTLRKCYKRFKGTTFNDYFLGILSKGFDTWFKKSGITGAEFIKTLVTINMRELPKSKSEFRIENDTSALKFGLPLNSGLQEAVEGAQKGFRSLFNKFSTTSIGYSLYLMPYLPEICGKLLMTYLYHQADCLFSNIPISADPWYLCNREAQKFGFFAHTHHEWKLFIVVTTYKERLRVTLSANENLKMDPQVLLDSVSDTLRQEIAQLNKLS